MNINCRNNISFGAKLNIKSMKTDKDRWKNIAKILGNAFKEDIKNINNGYPILNWQ